MNEHGKKQVERLLHPIDHLDEQPSEEHRGPEETHARPTIHVYLTDEPDESEEPEEANTIESTIEQPPDAEHAAGTKVLPRAAHALTLSKRTVFITVVLVCLLAVGGALWWSLLAVWTPSATVTLVPITQEVTINSSVVITTTGVAIENDVPGRLLSSLTLSQEQTIKTTGVGHQAARAAQGTLTFYNASLATQTIPAGQVITSDGGIQFVTEQAAMIPAGTGATNGQVSVPVHALEFGPQGNIQADALNTMCCRGYVLMRNTTAFTGGQEARAYPMVIQHDIDSAMTFLKNSLEQSEQAAYQNQVHSDETLLTPLACAPQVTTDTQAGNEASTVTVTLDESCRAVTYNTQAMHLLVIQSLNQQASKQLGTSYHLSGDIQTQISSTAQQQQATISLHVQGKGTYASQFSEHTLTHMRRLIAGKSQMQAKDLLLHTPGVRMVSLSITSSETTHLPTDTKQIRFLIIEPAPSARQATDE